MTLLERATALGVVATVPLVLVLLVVATALRWPVATVAVIGWMLVWGVAGIVAVRRRRRTWRLAALDPQVGRLRNRAVSAHPQTSTLGLAPASHDLALSGTVQNVAAGSLAEVEAYAVHSGSPLALRALALHVTAARLEAQRLVELANAPEPMRSVALGDVDADAVVALLRALSAHAEPTPGLTEAAFSLLAEHVDAVSASRAAEAARLCVENGRVELAALVAVRAPADWRRTLLAADLIDARIDPRRWEQAIGVLYDAAGLEPLQLREGEGSPFERVYVDAPTGSVGGPLVSVIMTAWKPGPATHAAVRSVLHQTWADLELLIVDDASGVEYDHVFDQLAALDPRVRVIRAADNGGTYRRRDDGISAARGELVAFHDADDLSHPRRLEIQARWLLAHPQAAACVTTALRMGDDVVFSQPRGLDLRLCEPSIMIRSSLLATVGAFDSVRAGGDVEFRERIARVTGRDVAVVRTAAPLTLQRWDASSLSGGDFAAGWSHPARLVYRSSHAWARRTGAPIPVAPARLRGVRPSERTLDTVILVDARVGTAGATALGRASRALRSAIAQGRSIGIMHSPGPVGRSHERDLCSDYHKLVAAGAHELIAADDPVSAASAIVLEADAVLGLSARCGLRVDELRVVGSLGKVPAAELAALGGAVLGAGHGVRVRTAVQALA